jgi:hypothetical protein
MSEAFHIVAETPPNTGTYTETGEVIATEDYQSVVMRCIELSQNGTRYGYWVETGLARSGEAQGKDKAAPGKSA